MDSSMSDGSPHTLMQHLRTLRTALSTINRITKSPRREPADSRKLADAETQAEGALRALEAAVLP